MERFGCQGSTSSSRKRYGRHVHEYPLGPYLDRMVGSASSGFSDRVIVGEQIENCLKIDKIQDTTVVASGVNKSQSGLPKKKEDETNAATTVKEEDRAYQMSYYQVAAVAPNSYQQQIYVIPIGHPPMQYQKSYAPQQPYAPEQQNYHQ